MSTRDDLRQEVEVLLGAARELPPDVDPYLAERFLSQLEQRRIVPRPHRLPAVRIRRRATALLLALAVLALGGSVTILQHTKPSATGCLPSIVKDYPSKQAAQNDRRQLEAAGYWESASRELTNGAVIIVYHRTASCTG